MEIVGNAIVSEDTDAVEIPVTEEKMPMLTKERLKILIRFSVFIRRILGKVPTEAEISN